MSWAIWITGRPGSGKSSLARRAAAVLRAEGEAVVVLELDEVRRVLTPSPTYSDAERELVYRALVWIALSLTESGIPVIVDATAHRRRWRDLARDAIGAFAEVQVHCPLAVCREREATRSGTHAPRGIYARAGQPGGRVPGVDVPYEEALAPELDVDTCAESVEAGAGRIAALARALPRTGERPPKRRGAAWAIWITGLPGSGKTTVAFGAARALAADGIPVRVLSFHEACHYVVCGAPAFPGTGELFHRTLVYAATRLTAAGVPVLIDATASRRRWRDLARELIPHFAEVELRCPREVCALPTRAERRQPAGCHDALGWSVSAAADPDLVSDYQPPLRPERVLATDVETAEAATASVVGLARSLHQSTGAFATETLSGSAAL